MTKKILTLAWMVAGLLAAGKAQTAACPVTVTDVKNIENAMYVFFQNDENRTITSYQFGFIFVDVKGAEHAFPLFASGSASVKPAGAGNVRLPSSTTLQFLFPTANAYLLKATFQDGTTWNDDGKHACGATSWQE